MKTMDELIQRYQTARLLLPERRSCVELAGWAHVWAWDLIDLIDRLLESQSIQEELKGGLK